MNKLLFLHALLQDCAIAVSAANCRTGLRFAINWHGFPKSTQMEWPALRPECQDNWFVAIPAAKLLIHKMVCVSQMH